MKISVFPRHAPIGGSAVDALPPEAVGSARVELHFSEVVPQAW